MKKAICIVNNCTTNTKSREIKYFYTLKKRKENGMTIARHNALIVDSGTITVTLPMGTQIVIEDALMYPDSTRTLLSYKYICQNGFY